MRDTNTDNAATDDDNTDKAIIGKASTVHVPLPPHSKEKLKIQVKLRHPQNMQFQLQNFQQVTSFQKVMTLQKQVVIQLI